MTIHKVFNKHEGAELLSKMIIEQLKINPNLKIGLITVSTPIETYQLLVQDYQKNKTDWSKVKTFNLDEYVGLKPNDKNSYHYFMHEHLFNHINLKKENIFMPTVVGDMVLNIKNYEKLLQENAIDIQLLGVGENGHIGFNEPFTLPDTATRVVSLTQNTIVVNQRFFKKAADVPKQALTMGIKNILAAKHIILVAFGKNKSKAIKALIDGEVDHQWPCSYLKNHCNVTVIIDQEASSLLV